MQLRPPRQSVQVGSQEDAAHRQEFTDVVQRAERTLRGTVEEVRGVQLCQL